MEAPLELTVSVFSDPNRAGEALKALQQSLRDGSLEIKNAAVLVRGDDGDLKIKETEDVDPARGALFGAITGGLIGLLAGPAGALTGAVAGAATGGITAALVDMGFSNDQLRDLKSSMPPNSSALVVLVEHTWVEKLAEQLRERRGEVFQHAVSPRLAERYQDER